MTTSPSQVRYALNVSGFRGSRSYNSRQAPSGYSIPGGRETSEAVQVMWRPGDHVPESLWDAHRAEALDSYQSALEARGFVVERGERWLTVSKPDKPAKTEGPTPPSTCKRGDKEWAEHRPVMGRKDCARCGARLSK